MTERTLKGVAPKLVPFFKAVLVYFVVLPADGPSWTGVVVKVLPVLSLALFVLLHEGIDLGLGDECWFARRVLLALAVSALADALLVWPSLFVSGMAVFGVAHLLYINAFGFRPLKPALGLGLYAASAWVLSFLAPGLSGPLTLGVPLYAVILVTMLWRAVAQEKETARCVGAMLFAVSDALIGFHMFHNPIPHSQVLIMTTYYAAQLGMALSVVGQRAGLGSGSPVGTVGHDRLS